MQDICYTCKAFLKQILIQIFIKHLVCTMHPAVHREYRQVSFFFKLIFRDRGKERETHTHTDLLFHLSVHSLVHSCMCPDQESNLQPWPIKTIV